MIDWIYKNWSVFLATRVAKKFFRDLKIIGIQCDLKGKMVNLVQSLEPKHYTAASFKGMPATSFKEKKQKTAAKEEDKILPNDIFSKMSYNIKKTRDIALTHFPRGLYGAPDYTFFEFLQTAKFPYYVGGPILAALFYAGVKYDNQLAGNAAKKVAKHMALGVALYYAAASLAKGIINTTVQLTRGIDLNHPYQRVISKTPGYTGIFQKGLEIQKVYGSNEFTRWDVIYNKEGETLAKINERYTDMGKKFKIKAETEDPDGTLKHLIKKTIIMSKAWQYALTALFVPVGIGIANQKAWEAENIQEFKGLVKNGILNKNLKLKSRMENTGTALKDYIFKPFAESVKQFWRGNSTASSIVGKSFITTAVLGTLLAIGLITTRTTAKNYKVEDKKTDGVKS